MSFARFETRQPHGADHERPGGHRDGWRCNASAATGRSGGQTAWSIYPIHRRGDPWLTTSPRRADRGSGNSRATTPGAIRATRPRTSLGFRNQRPALKGIRRTYAAPVAQAAALKPKMIRAILCELDDTPIDRRDGALIALLFAGALRRSEIWRPRPAGRSST
jgi:hypothetical protein